MVLHSHDLNEMLSISYLYAVLVLFYDILDTDFHIWGNKCKLCTIDSFDAAYWINYNTYYPNTLMITQCSVAVLWI